MFHLLDKKLGSRLLLGTALYPSPDVMRNAILGSKTDVVTVSLRRQSTQKNSGNPYWDYLKQLNCHILPNTAGCHTAREAITTAHMAREIFNTPWVKLEVIGDQYNLQPNPFELLSAAKELIAQGFDVLPYCTDDLILCQKLVEAGCKVIMPWAAPIGSGQGIVNPYQLNLLRKRLPDITLIVDAGLGKPSDACIAMEMGFDAVLLNSAVALANDPAKMAKAFADAVRAGRAAYEAGMMPKRELASPSTPLVDTPFWTQA